MRQKIADVLKYAVDRACEPSSWSGVGVVLMALGLHIKSDIVAAIGFIGPGVAGLLAVFLKES